MSQSPPFAPTYRWGQKTYCSISPISSAV